MVKDIALSKRERGVQIPLGLPFMNAGHQKLRDRAYTAYYANPSVCLECGRVIMIGENEQPGIVRRKRFCNHSCAATYTNGHKPRKHTLDCGCGWLKSHKSGKCMKCVVRENLSTAESRMISELISKGNARVKFAAIRTWASRAMKFWKVPKQCVKCGFDIVIEVHHWKSLSSFPTTTLIGVANSRENLDYLCPNHHAMAEKGLLKREQIYGE